MDAANNPGGPGPGTISLFAYRNGQFTRVGSLPMGPGPAQLVSADLNGDGWDDLIVGNSGAGTLTPYLSNGHGGFQVKLPIAVGLGASDFTVSDDVLAGLRAGRFASPVALPTKAPAHVVRVADFNHDGVSDLVLLGTRGGVSVLLGNGQGDFSSTKTFSVGPDPTGLTVADINHDDRLDLLVGNRRGDVLVRLGNGDGTFQPYYKTDQSVSLAVADLTGHGTKDFIFADQGLDRVVVDYGEGQTTVLGDSSTGLRDPGAVTLADFNSDGIKDLIVANSGSNNVLVYQGLVNGRFEPALSFPVGTNPVGISVADVNGDGRQDLVVANKGSNDVSILLNQPQGNSLTFTQGPQLKAGYGPCPQSSGM